MNLLLYSSRQEVDDYLPGASSEIQILWPFTRATPNTNSMDDASHHWTLTIEWHHAQCITLPLCVHRLSRRLTEAVLIVASRICTIYILLPTHVELKFFVNEIYDLVRELLITGLQIGGSQVGLAYCQRFSRIHYLRIGAWLSSKWSKRREGNSGKRKEWKEENRSRTRIRRQIFSIQFSYISSAFCFCLKTRQNLDKNRLIVNVGYYRQGRKNIPKFVIIGV